MRTFLGTTAFVATGLALAGACSSSEGGSASNVGRGGGPGSGGSGGTTTTGDSSSVGGSGATLNLDASIRDVGLNEGNACAQQSAEATLVKKPVDIIIPIDNSGSMGTEILAVQQNLNTNFTQILDSSSIDYRVIMIARHGNLSDEDICISAPLSGVSCSPVPPAPVNNPPKFFHYDNGTVRSHDSWCRVLEWYNMPDRHGFSQGWSDWLRLDALKIFIEITDDGVSCGSYNDGNNPGGGTMVAQQFDTDLLALDPAQFGTATDRNYVWYSIIGIQPNTPPTAPWLPTDPVITGECSTAADPGTGYQALSNLTGGLKFPVCEGMGFDAVFQAVAQGVIEGAKVACDFPVPDPPEGQMIDFESVVVSYTAGDGGAGQQFTQVPDAASCTPGSFYIVNEQTIFLCPDACAVVQGDNSAKLSILFACDSGGAI